MTFTVCHGKSPFLIGKPSINGPFPMAMLNNQRSEGILSGWWCNNHLEKYEFANGKDDIPYIVGNKKCYHQPAIYNRGLSQYIPIYPNILLIQ
jgi:hypothetical protein